jgi:ATP-dependent RNA helicase RhlE
MKDIERLIGQKIPQETVEGFEPDPTIRRKDQDELKLKSEHKKPEVKRVTKKKKTTSRDAKK